MNFKKREEIIAEAKKLILSKGFNETSMRDIAAALKIQASSIYNHFESKDLILETICNDVRARFQRIRTEISESVLNPQIKFHHFLRRYVTEILADEEAFEIYTKYSNYSDKYRHVYLEGQLVFTNFLRTLINDVKELKKPKILHENSGVLMLIYSLNLIPKLIQDRSNADVDAIVEDLYNIFIYGLIDRPSSSTNQQQKQN